MPSFLLVHYILRIGAALACVVAIAWIRHNDSARERRRLMRQGDCLEED